MNIDLTSSKACFNPEESARSVIYLVASEQILMVRMWQRMSESEGGQASSIDFASTHPANAKRIRVSNNSFLAQCQNSRDEADMTQQLTKWLPEVSKLSLSWSKLTDAQAQQIRAASSCGEVSSQYGNFLDTLSPSSAFSRWR